MDYRKIEVSHINQLWELQKAYKAEIGEDEPGEQECARLAAAIEKGHITFYGAWDEEALNGQGVSDTDTRVPRHVETVVLLCRKA